eukprot:TRINITY_DN2091_c0_g1_i1.p1 TRINITY_DN2091_c0_g1~~TRINITY_DN2091_c0_g1_i1.p1  ORF type:complete len:355 (+),score=143.35 TRINITY_DN2091_c0_g1_i1:67-1131(+)
MRRTFAALQLVVAAAATHEARPDQLRSDGSCVYPGVCTAPPAKYTKVLPVRPHQQWNINGGFCGAMSVQTSAMSYGAWISQDLVRKANTHGEGHGNAKEGFEVLPTNVAETARNLKLTYDEWDYNSTKPQADRYKAWLKKHLVQGHPVVWFIMCKGDSHVPYPGSNPNGGHFDHIEAVYGIGSNHSLDDLTVYDDDWLLHGSDQDLNYYYRTFASLVDTPAMQGNCKNAQAGVGRNEMYPCVDSQVDYGLAVTGMSVKGSLPVSLDVNIQSEPDVRVGMPPKAIKGTVTVSGLQAGKTYTIYRYGSTAKVPASAPFAGADHTHSFTASGASYKYADPNTFMSNSATYYVASEGS